MKLYFVQVVSSDIYKEKAEHQYVAGANYFDRGTIYFSSKDGTLVPGASVKSGFVLAINPEILTLNSDTQLQAIYDKIANTGAINDSEEFYAKVHKQDDPYEELASKLSTETGQRIENLEIPGVTVYKNKWRIYPGGSMAAQAVGLIGYKGDELAGRYGLERYYENVLKRSGDEAFVNFFAEIFSNIKKSVTPGDSPEGDIVTTIEPSVESFLEDELIKVENTYSSEFSGGVIIDPNTGEIYAMAENPTFNPNDLSSVAEPEVFRNKSIEDRYEMGSIIKALTMAAGIDTGAVTPTTTYNDPGCETLNRKTFCNYDGVSHGNNLTMQTVLNKSLNTGVAFVVSKMGNSKFRDYFKNYGLGDLTGIDLPNEGKSLVSNLDTGRDLEYAQASFGQGIALTPIVTVRALSTLANGGYLITPHLVKEVDYKIGTKKTIEPEKGRQVLKTQTTETISRMLTGVVDNALKNGTVRLPHYSVAAKTGTAQIAKPGGGGYYEDRYLHSFFGYFPSYDPKFLIFLYTYYPKNVQYASETLTDSFIDLTKFLINYYSIPPDRDAPPPPAR
ncbi:penicillin-binding protein 2 [Candidatus Parcubacteria bacterium]|nr:penicillin-binding protein 2 [Candidatus Parcubacteria bacterium]